MKRGLLSRCFCTLAAGLLLSAASTCAAVISPTLVALSGTAAPAGGNYSSFDTTTVINASGEVEFVAATSIAGNGVFAGNPGSTMTTVALQGTTAPAGGHYSGSFAIPVLNPSGQVAFLGSTSPSGAASFGGTPGGTIANIALQGGPAPVGGNYTSIGSPVLNDSGHVGFNAGTTGSGNGIFYGIPGSTPTVVALIGNAAPSGGNYIGIGSGPVLNSLGQVAFIAGTSGGNGIFFGTPGSTLTTVAFQGTVAPSGGNYSALTANPSINSSGKVAFTATTSVAGQGIFVGTPGATMTTAAIAGTAAPAGGQYSTFSNPVLNASGQLAFRATLTGGTSTGGIFRGSPGSLQTIVLEGTTTPDGVGNFNTVSGSVTLNSSGQVAFLSSLSGAGVTTANDNGLYAGTAGNLVKIVREGDIVDVDPTGLPDLRTVSAISFLAVSGGEDGRGVGLNDSGLLVYRLTFADNSSGIFTSQIPVPEPASLSLIALAGLAMFHRRPRAA